MNQTSLLQAIASSKDVHLVDVEERVDGEDECSADGLRHGQGPDTVEWETLLGPDEGRDLFLHVEGDDVKPTGVFANCDAADQAKKNKSLGGGWTIEIAQRENGL